MKWIKHINCNPVCGLLVLQVSIYLQNWPHVTTYVSKAETTPYLMEVIWLFCAACSLFPCCKVSVYALSYFYARQHICYFSSSWMLTLLTAEQGRKPSGRYKAQCCCGARWTNVFQVQGSRTTVSFRQHWPLRLSRGTVVNVVLLLGLCKHMCQTGVCFFQCDDLC